jgi:ABC-type proline/glycine betaine transport system substrate-binding protein
MTAMDYAVNGLDPLSAARQFMDEHSDDVRPWFG